MSLNYIPPTIVKGKTVVQLDKDKVEKENAKWRCALVVYVMGEIPGYKYMSRYVEKTWSTIAKPELFLYENGFYVARFQSLGDMKKVLYSGPHTIGNKPIILKQWTVEFDFTKEFLTDIPLWVYFPNLPMNYTYARILIEVNVTQSLPDQITVMDPIGRCFQHDIWFEWNPNCCDKCIKVGHVCTEPK
ncbi:hypothetical protein R3W88_025111 [Solanum pinnatisectum]|uniref:DUF4283 domain-containing protein n=1 Tax=Solanum pinnatisectum TaxID=50273 RepID=A0AAV9M328_9SOLN|nr:hypothetical protein R3W88_025111 [Solanum pinnatisectum]